MLNVPADQHHLVATLRRTGNNDGQDLILSQSRLRSMIQRTPYIPGPGHSREEGWDWITHPRPSKKSVFLRQTPFFIRGSDE